MSWIVLLVLAIAAMYLYDYYRTPPLTSAMQTSVSHFSFDMLREKQPIVLHESVRDLEQLHKAWFRWNMTSRFDLPIPSTESPTWVRNRYKHLLLWPQQDAEILMYPAGKRMEDGQPDPSHELLAMRLRAHQVVILPYRWHYLLPQGHVQALGVHDLVTFVLP